MSRLIVQPLACLTVLVILGHAPPPVHAQIWELPPNDSMDTFEQPAVGYSSAEDLFLVPMAGDDLVVRWFDPDQPADGSPSMHPDGYEGNWQPVPSYSYPRPDRSRPAVAHDPTSNLALVVFAQESQQGNDDIWGALCDGDGLCTSTPFSIASSIHDEGEPRVAFSPDTQRYLVVWRRTVQYSGFWPNDEVVGRFVSANGLPTGSELVLSSGFQARAPSVAYSPDDQYFLVVWEDQPAFIPYEMDIAGCWVRADGSHHGTSFAVSSDAGDQVLPRVAYDVDHMQYLIVWEDRRWDSDIFGRRLHYAGAFLGASFPIAWLGSNARSAPDVTYEPGTQVYRVAYEFASTMTNRDIRSRSVNAQGQLGRSEVTHSSFSFDECNVAIASRPSETLVVWQSCVYYPYPIVSMNTIFGTLL